jgi:hypothetical protein
MTHAQLVERAVNWLRSGYRCGIVLSEQACCTGEVPDVIGWKGRCRSVVIECKISRADFLSDLKKPWRHAPNALGCERFYLAPKGLISADELPKSWGLLECCGRQLSISVKPNSRSQRTPEGLLNEMNLLLSSLRRVEVRIEPQTITDFLKWKNRLATYNGGSYPAELAPPSLESNPHLSTRDIESEL